MYINVITVVKKLNGMDIIKRYTVFWGMKLCNQVNTYEYIRYGGSCVSAFMVRNFENEGIRFL
jgi:hypothetical protein